MPEPDDLLPTSGGTPTDGGPAGSPSDLDVPATGSSSPLPFQDLRIPTPTPAAPPLTARVLAFAAILVGGLLGALIGYGTADLMAGSAAWAVLGLLVGALAGAVGVGVVAGLTLRAMNEWNATSHPEADPTSRRTHQLRPQARPRPDRRTGGSRGPDGPETRRG